MFFNSLLKEKFRSGPGHSKLAVLFPWQVGQLWISGETMTRHPSEHGEMEGEYQFFTEPVRVTREQVRIKAQSLKKIQATWDKAQAGAWINDESFPGGKRHQRGPGWMFPQMTAADDDSTTAAKVGAVPVTSQSIGAWKLNARQIGEGIHKATPSLSVERIAEKTHKEMTGRNAKGEPGMTGRGGKVPAADTIKRWALTGIKA